MQKPDSEGYVHVQWPSRNVPHGGIFHTHKAQFSADQQQFLKVLLEESKLSMKLRQNDGFGLRLDLEKQKKQAASNTGHRVSETAPPLILRPRTSRRRSLSAIRSSGIYDEEAYRPMKRGEDREKLKAKLAHSMAFGDTAEQQIPVLRQKPQKTAPKLPTAKETWNELVMQIRERAEWLAEMEWLGQAAAHREIIQDQIAERMRALDALGIDSACTTPCPSSRSSSRTIARTTRQPQVAPSPKITSSSPKGTKMLGSVGRRQRAVEENVAAYDRLSPLGYSPRRRV